MASLYLYINFFSVIVPFLFSFHPKINFYKTWKAVFPAHLIAALIFLVWDSVFTMKGIWGFNEKYLCGMYIFNLPLEEVLFFLCIPYACLFTYFCLNLYLKKDWKKNQVHLFSIFLSFLLLIIGFVFYDKLYTSFTFISTAFLILFLQFVIKIQFLGRLFRIYPVLLVPFFIVNGILTGSGLEMPVVWYNNAENLGIRILTIPIEDFVYGFELILLNIFLYTYFLKIMKQKNISFV